MGYLQFFCYKEEPCGVKVKKGRHFHPPACAGGLPAPPLSPPQDKHWKAGGGVHAPLEEQLTFFSLPAGKSETGLSGCSFGTKKSANP